MKSNRGSGISTRSAEGVAGPSVPSWSESENRLSACSGETAPAKIGVVLRTASFDLPGIGGAAGYAGMNGALGKIAAK